MTADNYFVCCRRCQNSRQASDLISVASLPDDLRAQRSTVMQMSANHLVGLPRSADLPQVRAALAVRHAFPRSRIYAAQCDDGTCFIGVAARYGDGQSKGLAHLLGRLAGSPVHSGKRLTVYRFTDDAFRKTVWDLIEANALVVGLARRGVLRDHLDWWWLTSASVGELRARKVGRLAAPDPVADKKVSGSALRQRRLVARRRLEDELWLAQRELKEAEYVAGLLMEARDNPGTALTVDPDEAVEVLLRPAALEQRLAQLKTEFEEVRKRAA